MPVVSNKRCVVIGASHAGVNLAFSLRREGWQGEIVLFDSDAEFPYHRPPLSKGYLTSEEGTQHDFLFPKENYQTDNITLNLGKTVHVIRRETRQIIISDGSTEQYDTLVLATGARPSIPAIQGMENTENIFSIRTARDSMHIKKAVEASVSKRVVIIGGGYIGLETAASLKKMGADVTILEREGRVLSRVTSGEISGFFEELHGQHGVAVLFHKNVISITDLDDVHEVICDDHTSYQADIIVVAVGIKVNTELAEQAGLEIGNGIKVDGSARTNDEHIYAVGDCTFHYNPHYQRCIRLESVQNAVDQAKIAAISICGKEVVYDTIPWFWSDQYDVKFQAVGLLQGYDQAIQRVERNNEKCRSVWYFKEDELLAVDAVNNAKAYVLGTRFIRNRQKIDRSKLADVSIPIKPLSFI